MKILVYNNKIKKHMFLKGSRNDNSLWWTANFENAGDYSYEEFNQVKNEYKNGMLSNNFVELGHMK